MKLSKVSLAAGFVAAVALVALSLVIGGDAIASTIHHLAFADHGGLVTASAALVSMRAELVDLQAQATAKMTEMKDGLPVDQVRAIETAHAEIVTKIKAKETAITAEEAKAKTWAGGFYMSAGELGVSLADLNSIVASSDTHEAAKDALIRSLAKRDAGKPAAGSAPTVTLDARDKFVQGVTLALENKTGVAAGERNEFSGRRMFEIARMALEINGIRASYRDDYQMIGAAMAPVVMAGQLGTSDFVNILANVAHKSMLKGYEEAEETFAQWTATGTLTDFKTVSRVDMGVFPALDKLEEGAEYNYAKLTDRGVTLALATYGKMFGITRQAIINDDLNAFTRIPGKMGRAAHRTIGNLVYALINANGNMADGNALFSAAHKNVATGGGSVLGVASLDAGRVAMAKQQDKDANATALNIRPAFLLVPVGLQGSAHQLMASQTEPGQNNAALSNRVANMAKVVSDARLDAASATAWYLSASPASVDTIEVSYLNGVQTPTLEQVEGWKVDGVEFKVRHDAGVNLLDFVGLYKGVGA